jgi:hypothetical protein
MIGQVTGQRRERLIVGSITIGIVLAYAWSGHVWVDVVDEGYFLDLADRVQNGALPYRDFATYYTPGIFYLFALVFKLFGTNLLAIRYLMAALRGLSALLLYGLTRRAVPPAWAWLPFVVIAAGDAWPIEPEPHPSWPALVASLATMECVARHLETGRVRWLVLAGAGAAMAYLFKQNIGAFAALALAGYVLLRPRLTTVPLLRALQVAFAVGTAGLVLLLMRDQLDPLWVAALLLPVLGALAVLLFQAIRASPVAADRLMREALAAGGSFALVTAAWFAPLSLALGPGNTPVGLFLGQIDQGSIAEQLPPFTPGIAPVLLLGIWTPILVLRRWPPSTRLLPLGLLLSGVALGWPRSDAPASPVPSDALTVPLANWLEGAFGSLPVYLPALAIWLATGGLLLSGAKKSLTYPYFVLFGALGALALYPRADALHAVISSPAPLVAGTAALASIAEPFAGWRRAAVVAALLSVPIAALAPQLEWRFKILATPGGYEPLDVDRAPVLVPRETAETMRGVVDYLQAGTPPGEPVLVYPVAPLINFLAARPNPTRVEHFLAGTLSAGDFAEIIGDLRRTQPRYVVWDDYGVHFWETDTANRPLSDYIWGCYHQVAVFKALLILERNADGC